MLSRGNFRWDMNISHNVSVGLVCRHLGKHYIIKNISCTRFHESRRQTADGLKWPESSLHPPSECSEKSVEWRPPPNTSGNLVQSRHVNIAFSCKKSLRLKILLILLKNINWGIEDWCLQNTLLSGEIRLLVRACLCVCRCMCVRACVCSLFITTAAVPADKLLSMLTHDFHNVRRCSH